MRVSFPVAFRVSGVALTVAMTVALMLSAPAVRAVDSSDTVAEPAAGKPAAGKLAAARAKIAAQDWPGAIRELRSVNDTASADWHNLMGYSLRKAATPDLAAAERHYDEALRIDPKHRGALEYLGELQLMKGELPRAELLLVRLDQLCPRGCEEQADLKKAIARYKAAGNRYVAAP